MKPLVIFKVGDTFTRLAEQLGDFDRWIINGIGDFRISIAIVDPRKGDDLPDVSDVAAAVVTGSHSMVSDRAPWSEKLAAWLRCAVAEEIPVLGICYGHQLLAHALGGEVGYHPDGIELGTVSVRLTKYAKDDALFGGMPEEFAVQVVHRQSALKLPDGAVLLAGNTFEPHHAFRFGDSAWGVQFHPEFSATAMSGYIKELAMDAECSELAAEPLQGKVLPTAEAASILPRFTKLVTQRIGI